MKELAKFSRTMDRLARLARLPGLERVEQRVAAFWAPMRRLERKLSAVLWPQFRNNTNEREE